MFLCCCTVCSFATLFCIYFIFFKQALSGGTQQPKVLQGGNSGSNCCCLIKGKQKVSNLLEVNMIIRQMPGTLLIKSHHILIAYRCTLLSFIFAKCDSNCGVQRRMSAEGSLPAESRKEMTKTRDKGGENPVDNGGHNLNLNTKLTFLNCTWQLKNIQPIAGCMRKFK